MHARTCSTAHVCAATTRPARPRPQLHQKLRVKVKISAIHYRVEVLDGQNELMQDRVARGVDSCPKGHQKLPQLSSPASEPGLAPRHSLLVPAQTV